MLFPSLRQQAARLLPIFLLLLLPSLATAALFERSTFDLQAETLAAAKGKKLLAVFLTLPDCPGCLEMERTVFNEKSLNSAVDRKFRHIRLDITQQATLIDPGGKTTTPASFARSLRAIATPSFAFFDGRGQILYRYTGTLDAAGFRQLLGFVEREEYEQRPFTLKPTTAQAAAVKFFAEPPAATLPRQPAFRLAATDGKTRSPKDFHGKVIALAVGYTTCPDVCPTTLHEMKTAVELLPLTTRRQIQLLFATLDPERDSLEMLREYAAAFRPDGGLPILGLRGDAQQTASLIRTLQLVADKRPSDSMGYTLDHTAGVFLFDGKGRLLGLSPYGQPIEKLASDLSTATRLTPAKTH
jgi:protein SCO1/2